MKKIDTNQNLVEKEILINRLKNLIDDDISVSKKYQELKKIQNSWFKIGPVPRTKSKIIWNNFQHHIKNFYDYLHLNRKFKEIDLEHNRIQKEKILLHAKDLINSNDKIKIWKDFQRLKKRWNYELGPVEKKFEKELNIKLEEIENEINKSKKHFEVNKDSILEKNYDDIIVLLEKGKSLIEDKTESLKSWQKRISDFEKIKRQILNSGPIPKTLNKKFWTDYKKLIKEFYSQKNSFFKNLKKIYSDNIEKQFSLINEVEKILDNDNPESLRSQIISIQKKWKLIKPVPYKVNKKNWLDFKSKCDIFFKKLNEKKNFNSKELFESNEKQKSIIEKLNSFNGKQKDLEKIIEIFILTSVSNSKNVKIFYNKINSLFLNLGLNNLEIEKIITEIKAKCMNSDQINQEINTINQRLDILKKELVQQENNLSFFKEESKENKLLEKVHKKINKNKIEIENLNKMKKSLLK
ncbi:MAG: DUF349 domain-containing protein [Flavobacteriaceae bacterium]|nr:MAG: DUF349 domain-containing protein [Cryomorphaceae bacterium]